MTNLSHACKLPLSHCLIKLPELQYSAHTDRIFSACSSDLWDLSDLINLIDECVCFVSFVCVCVCLARAPATLKLGTPASRSLILFPVHLS